MPHVIIRRAKGRRHEVDFRDAPVRVEIHSSEETVEILIEADFEGLPQGRRRFALPKIPRHLFSPNDLRRSLIALDHDSALTVVADDRRQPNRQRGRRQTLSGAHAPTASAGRSASAAWAASPGRRSVTIY